MPDNEAAQAIKATVNYFLRGEVPNLTGAPAQVFDSMRSSIDRGQESYRKMSEAGKRGNDARWHRNR